MTHHKNTYDYLIVGQGLAGSFLGWRLLEKQSRIIVVDNNHHQSASLAAAGIVNPLTNKRFIYTENFHQYFPSALNTYQELENLFQQKFFHRLPTLRIFQNAEERLLWEKQTTDSVQLQKNTQLNNPGLLPEIITDPHGSALIGESAWCDIGPLLTSFQKFFEKKDSYQKKLISYREILLTDSGVIWKNDLYKRVIFCEGFHVRENPWFGSLPLSLSKGETLELNVPLALPEKILNSGKWLLPLENGTARAGATFDWENIDCIPTEKGKNEILSQLQSFLKIPWLITGHRSGVRTSGKDLAPLIGIHPKHPQLGIFNGFGTKGVLTIPLLSQLFTDQLLSQHPLPPALDIQRYPKSS